MGFPRSAALAFVALLVATAASGCLGGNSYRYVTVTKGLSTGTGTYNGSIPEGKGVVEGTVLSEDGLVLRGAHVAIVGGREFTTTDHKGHFFLAGLEPRGYTLRVNRDGYLGAQHVVTVVEGKVVYVEVVLEPSNSLAPGQREHVHDLWEGVDEKMLWEGDVHFASTTDTRKTAFPTGVCVSTLGTGNSPGSAQECYHAPFFLPEGKVVPPWTSKLRLTLSWDDASFATVDLRYKNATSKSPSPVLKSIADGGTVEIGVNESTADHGHARWSTWAFSILARPLLVSGQATTAHSSDWTNENHGPVRARVVAIRGDPYPEKAHARPWANGSRLVLLQDELHTPANNYGRDPTAGSTYACGSGFACFLPKSVVPPGTTRLVVTLRYAPATEGWPANSEKGLAIRTAKVNPFTATWGDLRVEDSLTRDGDAYTFEYKLLPDETDPYYLRSSNFALFPNPKGAERDPNVQQDCPTTGCGGDKYTMTVEAINDNWRPEYATGSAEA